MRSAFLKQGLAWVALPLLLILCTYSPSSAAAGGPLGIDHRLAYDDRGIWKRTYQTDLQYAVLAASLGGSLLFGDEDELGDTCWRSFDSFAFSAAAAQAAKYIFARARPTQTDDPNRFFDGHGHQSFPSGEVTAVASVITPFVLRYGSEQPAVYALELLPLYDGIARMKLRAHWQTDVLAGWALGTVFGYLALKPEQPIILDVLPHGFRIGLVHRF